MSEDERIYDAAELIPEMEIDSDAIEKAIASVIKAVGENPKREGMKRTPSRVASMYEELLVGYRTDPIEMLNDAIFDVTYDEMVLVRDIEFYSMCEHHMLPFIGRAHVAYIPKGRVIGLSKIPRIVDLFARRFQVQERMTRQIADMLCQLLKPQGAAVVLEAIHLCSMMRGVKKHDAIMTTSTMVGLFRSKLATRQEFLDSISRGAVPLRI